MLDSRGTLQGGGSPDAPLFQYLPLLDLGNVQHVIATLLFTSSLFFLLFFSFLSTMFLLWSALTNIVLDDDGKKCARSDSKRRDHGVFLFAGIVGEVYAWMLGIV